MENKISDTPDAAQRERQSLEHLRILQQTNRVNASMRQYKNVKEHSKMRNILIIIDWVIITVCCVSMAITAYVIKGYDFSFTDLFEGIISIILVIGCWIPGIMHTAKLRANLAGLLIIVFFGWIAYIIIYLPVIYFGGMAFLFADTFKLFAKKPLYFSWEK